MDVFLIMTADFNAEDCTEEAAALFDHETADRILGASVFSTTLRASEAQIAFFLDSWQIKRDQTRRGIVEALSDDRKR